MCCAQHARFERGGRDAHEAHKMSRVREDSVVGLTLKPRTRAAVVVERHVNALSIESQPVARNDSFGQ